MDDTYSTYVAFLYGFSAADESGEISRFRQWLVDGLGSGFNMNWSWLVLQKAFPDESRLWDPNVTRTEEEERRAIDALLGALEAYVGAGA
ncbi:hypothetical protein [Streptomyces sp. NPDC018833]|uniref:hypothetical protein n=1 Tax=Streptomyces sp. NPDC018833 TaxID=3365053 RepID=UPI0037920148